MYFKAVNNKFTYNLKVISAHVSEKHGCGVGGKMYDSDLSFPKFLTLDCDALTQHEWSLTANNFVETGNQWKS